MNQFTKKFGRSKFYFQLIVFVTADWMINLQE